MTKKKTEKEPNSAFINAYGFFHLDKDLAKHLGLKFGKGQEKTPVTIEHIEKGFIAKLKT